MRSVGNPARYFRFTSLLLIALILSLIGCAQKIPMGTVKGNVEFKGKPYNNAAVLFVSLETGRGSSANINSDGTFALPDALPLGNYKIFLAPKIGDPLAEPKPVKIDKSVPGKYWNESATDLSHEVTEGLNEVTVELKR